MEAEGRSGRPEGGEVGVLVKCVPRSFGVPHSGALRPRNCKYCVTLASCSLVAAACGARREIARAKGCFYAFFGVK